MFVVHQPIERPLWVQDPSFVARMLRESHRDPGPSVPIGQMGFNGCGWILDLGCLLSWLLLFSWLVWVVCWIGLALDLAWVVCWVGVVLRFWPRFKKLDGRCGPCLVRAMVDQGLRRCGDAWCMVLSIQSDCSKGQSNAVQTQVYGCFLKWWYPQNTPKWSCLVGTPMVVWYHHFRKPPY